MSSDSDLHNKLLMFLASALSRVETEMATKIEIEYAPKNGYRREMLKRWTREGDPEYFVQTPQQGADAGTAGGPGNMAFVEALAAEMLEVATNHADTYGEGRHPFIVRVIQHYGTRLTHRFVVLPAFDSDDADSERALVAGAGGTAGSLETPTSAGLVGQLMRHLESKDKNTERLINSFLGAVSHQANALREENTELRERLAAKDAEWSQHRKELDEARSLDHDRQIEAQRVVASEERKTMATRKVTALLPVLVSRLATPPRKEGEPANANGPQSTLGNLVQRFLVSLKGEQLATLGTALSMEQQVVLMEVRRVVTEHGDSPVLATMLGELSQTFSEAQLTRILTALDDVQRALFVRIIQISQTSTTAGTHRQVAAGSDAANGTEHASHGQESAS